MPKQKQMSAAALMGDEQALRAYFQQAFETGSPDFVLISFVRCCLCSGKDLTDLKSFKSFVDKLTER